jgi:molybdate transport system substrate-binding protein
MKRYLQTLIFVILSLFYVSSIFAGNKVIVFAAASTTNAVTDIGTLYFKSAESRFVPSFASSSTLAKQIEKGAPADIYISANVKWMNYLEEKGGLEPHTRMDLLGNRVVLIAPLESSIEGPLAEGFDLNALLGDGRLSMGDPDHVPAGIYGKQALVSMNIWDKVENKVVRAKDVRSALYFVEQKEAPLGIVYATDAAISKKVKVVYVFPESLHPAITYPVAIVKGKKMKEAMAFFEFLGGSEAKKIFESYGFSVK